ncbi:MAG TPA: PQQ-dependent sugar dehydrogenase, partial [Verrucomicrobiota bacterium]|nr:PQQ-dependent sugar dehydrogenase [Verrucomicrobiota bacterium]
MNTSIAGGGLFKRVNNNTILLPMEQRLFDYELVDAFAGLKFDRPVVIASPPGIKDRLFIAENGGVIVELNLSDNSKSNFLDISDRTISVAPSKSQEPGLLGLAFHPSFNSNGYIYVFYTTYSETKRGNGLHDRLSRFQVFSENKHKVNPESEVVMIDQYDRSFIHNSGDLHFGPD